MTDIDYTDVPISVFAHTLADYYRDLAKEAQREADQLELEAYRSRCPAETRKKLGMLSIKLGVRNGFTHAARIADQLADRATSRDVRHAAELAGRL